MAFVSKATRTAGANFIIEELYKEMQKAGSIDEFLIQHAGRMAKDNSERRKRYIRYNKSKEAAARREGSEETQGKSGPSSPQRSEGSN